MFFKSVFVVGILVVAVCGLPVEDMDNSVDGGDGINLSHLGVDIYGTPSAQTGEAVANWTEASEVNPEELGAYAEGDILFPPRSRNGMREQSLRWTDGIIPYTIEGYYSPQQRELIMRAIADYHRLTCLRFVPYTGQQDYVAILSRGSGCWSSVGRVGGRQEVNLQSPGCVTKKGTVLHELLHAAGFMHEQSRPERDDYVTVQYGNIKSGAENNFRKADARTVNDFGVSYDYNSVMHYSDKAFSRNGERTIVPRIGGVRVGQREGLSRGDVRKVNNMYECKKEEPQSGWLGAIWQGFFGNDDELAI